MAEKIEVSTRQIDSDVSSMKEYIGNVRTQMKQMFNEIEALNNMWEGPANDAFNEQFAKDYETLTTICNSIDDYIGCMTFASTEYVKCESAVGDAIAKITV